MQTSGPVVLVAQQRGGRSQPPALLRCWATLTNPRQARIGDRQTNDQICIISIISILNSITEISYQL